MFRNTRDPSSGSCIECLAKITVTVLSCPLIGPGRCYGSIYAAITPTTSISTDEIEPLL